MRPMSRLPLLALAGCVSTTSSAALAIDRDEIVGAAPAYEEHPWTCGAQNLVAECADTTCTTGDRIIIESKRYNRDTGVESLWHGMQLDRHEAPAVGYQICRASERCRTQRINVLRCEGTCSTTYQNTLIETWGNNN